MNLKTMFFCLFVILIGCSENKVEKKTEVRRSSQIYLYPGYLTKDVEGIFWHPQKPEYFDNKWIKEKANPLTGCINDPWPYSEGGEHYCLKIID